MDKEDMIKVDDNLKHILKTMSPSDVFFKTNFNRLSVNASKHTISMFKRLQKINDKLAIEFLANLISSILVVEYPDIDTSMQKLKELIEETKKNIAVIDKIINR